MCLIMHIIFIITSWCDKLSKPGEEDRKVQKVVVTRILRINIEKYFETSELIFVLHVIGAL